MNFETVRDALIDMFGTAAAGRFRVVGCKKQSHSAASFKGVNRAVQIYYMGGDFAKSAGRQMGTKQHDMTFTIGVTVSAASTVNLDILKNPASTAAQLEVALAAMQDAAYLADRAWDELAALVYQVAMDARNVDIGLPKGTVANRWVGSIQKDDPDPAGALVTISGTLVYTCRTYEDVAGDTGAPLTEGVHVGVRAGDAPVVAEVSIVPQQQPPVVFEDESLVQYPDGGPPPVVFPDDIPN